MGQEKGTAILRWQGRHRDVHEDARHRGGKVRNPRQLCRARSDPHRRDEPLFRSRRRGLPAQDRRGIPRNAGGYRADDTVLRGCGKDKIHRRADDRGRWRTEHRRRDRLYARR